MNGYNDSGNFFLNQAMAHCNTIFLQILKLVPRHEFESLANQHHQGRSFRTASRWSQIVTLAMAQLSGRNSLRDMVENVSAQAHRLYHLGSTKLSRSNLSRINEDKPYTLYEALFGKLLRRRQGLARCDINWRLPFYATLVICFNVHEGMILKMEFLLTHGF